MQAVAEIDQGLRIALSLIAQCCMAVLETTDLLGSDKRGYQLRKRQPDFAAVSGAPAMVTFVRDGKSGLTDLTHIALVKFLLRALPRTRSVRDSPSATTA